MAAPSLLDITIPDLRMGTIIALTPSMMAMSSHMKDSTVRPRMAILVYCNDVTLLHRVLISMPKSVIFNAFKMTSEVRHRADLGFNRLENL